jgi:hypothetical protein
MPTPIHAGGSPFRLLKKLVAYPIAAAASVLYSHVPLSPVSGTTKNQLNTPIVIAQNNRLSAGVRGVLWAFLLEFFLFFGEASVDVGSLTEFGFGGVASVCGPAVFAAILLAFNASLSVENNPLTFDA